MNVVGTARKTLQFEPARGGVADRRESAGTIAARPPTTGRVFDVGVEDVAPPVEPERNGVGRPPPVDGARVEERDQHVKLPARANELACCAQGIAERPVRNLLGVIGRLGGRHDETTHFSRRAAGMGGR